MIKTQHKTQRKTAAFVKQSNRCRQTLAVDTNSGICFKFYKHKEYMSTFGEGGRTDLVSVHTMVPCL